MKSTTVTIDSNPLPLHANRPSNLRIFRREFSHQNFIF
jgi:hypothetical protein